jgi:hypothetical protein
MTRRLSLRRVHVIFVRWQRDARFETHYNFHTFRHTAITNVYRATKDLFLTQRFARHASPVTTVAYTPIRLTRNCAPESGGSEATQVWSPETPDRDMLGHHGPHSEVREASGAEQVLAGRALCRGLGRAQARLRARARTQLHMGSRDKGQRTDRLRQCRLGWRRPLLSARYNGTSCLATQRRRTETGRGSDRVLPRSGRVAPRGRERRSYGRAVSTLRVRRYSCGPSKTCVVIPPAFICSGRT